MTTSRTELRKYALMLRNANPQAWEDFVNVFDAYATEVTVAVTRAPQNEILVAQGRAQQCLALLQDFRECTASPTRPPSPQ